MTSLYVSAQGCYVSLNQQYLLVKQRGQTIAEVQLPHTEQILIFGKSQITTQAVRACLKHNIAIVYLSRMGYCYGRLLPLERGYRQLNRYQQSLELVDRLLVARAIVKAKLKNCRVILQRQYRKKELPSLVLAIETLEYLSQKTEQINNIDQLMGIEGAGASCYFSVFGDCLTGDKDFVFLTRSRRPPANPVNAMLSFGYQVLWNHLLALIELQGLDPYQACLHQNSQRHAALTSDLLEEFRAPIVDSLVIYLVNRRIVNASDDFEYRDGGCFLNESGRKKYLKAFVQRMESSNQNQEPRWDLLMQQVKRYKQFIYNPIEGYQPYQIS
jgi:CRISPR-associated protein Cas1